MLERTSDHLSLMVSKYYPSSWYTWHIIFLFVYTVARASSNIEANVASRQICFSSLTDCSLANLTQYSVEIIDISGNTIFERDEISESTCLTVNELRLLPQCGPFTMSTRPMNDHIVYNLDVQEIPSGYTVCVNTIIVRVCLLIVLP